MDYCLIHESLFFSYNRSKWTLSFKNQIYKSFIDRAISPEKFLAEIFFPVVF